MNKSECPRCTRPIRDAGKVCMTCTDDLRAGLLMLAVLQRELEITSARYAKTTPGGGSKGTRGRNPLPINVGVTEAAVGLRAMVSGWNRRHGGAGLRDLANRIGRIRFTDESIRMMEHIDVLRRRLTCLIDIPVETKPLGPCPHCATPLRAGPHEPYVRCRGCGEQHDVVMLYDVMRGQARDLLMTATEISKFTRYANDEHPVTADRIYKWAKAGDGRRLFERAHNRKGQPTYRVGDVLDLIDDMTRKRRSCRRRSKTGRFRRLKSERLFGV